MRLRTAFFCALTAGLAAYAFVASRAPAPPPQQQITFGQYVKKICAGEYNDAKQQQDCYDRRILQRAFENSNEAHRKADEDIARFK